MLVSADVEWVAAFELTSTIGIVEVSTALAVVSKVGDAKVETKGLELSVV